jgi:signal transduction histidine kinase
MVALTRRKQINGGPRTSRITMRPPEGVERSSGRSRSGFERELHRLERLCETLREGAEKADLAQAELLKTLSHDLRNPLSVILVSTPMLARAIPPDQSSRRYVNAITRAAEEMNHMLQDFADAGMLETGRLVVERAPLEVGPMIEQALNSARLLAEPKGVRISSEIPEDTPAVLGDRERIVKVLSNLMSSAIRFTPKNGAITVRAEPDDDATLFSVADTGPGIPLEHRELVFTRPTGARRPIVQGAGLAFYVVKGVVEAHGGRVWVESEVGRGSSFFFTLPTTHVAEPIN